MFVNRKKAKNHACRLFEMQYGSFENFRAGSTIYLHYDEATDKYDTRELKYIGKKESGQYVLVYDEPHIFDKEKLIERFMTFDKFTKVQNNPLGKIVVRNVKQNKFTEPEYFPRGTKVLFSTLVDREQRILTVNRLIQNGSFSFCIETVETAEDKCYPIYKEGVTFENRTNADILGYEIKPEFINISHVDKIISRGTGELIIQKFIDDINNKAYDRPSDKILSILHRNGINIENIDADTFTRYLTSIGVIKIILKNPNDPYKEKTTFKYSKHFKKVVLQNHNRFRVSKASIIYEDEKFHESLYDDMNEALYGGMSELDFS